MKLNEKSGNRNSGTIETIKDACVATCRKALGRIAQAKAAIFAEARETLAVQERLLGLALNEAEALALQTAYPHLVFPTLALEKVQAVANWNQHQSDLNRRTPVLALAA